MTATPRNVAMDRLRSFVTLLVLLHHSLLAYHPYAPPAAPFFSPALLWTAFPVVDSARLSGAEWVVGFNDVFFMALMFLVSGLFVWPALARRGVVDFVGERLLRLGVPFMYVTALLAPLAYYPAWRTSGGAGGVIGFLRDWMQLTVWPAGPAWFLWVLLVFGVLAAVVYAVAPKAGQALGRLLAWQRPIVLFGLLAGLSALVYLPVTHTVDPMAWLSFGPFFVQITRVPLYALYFVMGIGMGAKAFEQGVLTPDGALAQRWREWLIAAPLVYVVLVAMQRGLATARAAGEATDIWRIAADLGFVASCAVSCLAFLALFLRFFRRGGWIGNSLSRNAYGIYLVHYVFVAWLQWKLLERPLPAIEKALLVFVGTLLLSWLTTAILRLIPAFARVL
ncbi:acyltransferase family protein [Dyella sp. 2RAB6]|uniref:acyltransferase family protein n=1 Tax=Dyella sp. 2RAB6 TaxID=3232992 RepID=UPI003F924A38